MALSEGSDQIWHLGARLALRESLNPRLEAGRRASQGEGAAHELALRATLGVVIIACSGRPRDWQKRRLAQGFAGCEDAPCP